MCLVVETAKVHKQQAVAGLAKKEGPRLQKSLYCRMIDLARTSVESQLENSAMHTVFVVFGCFSKHIRSLMRLAEFYSRSNLNTRHRVPGRLPLAMQNAFSSALARQTQGQSVLVNLVLAFSRTLDKLRDPRRLPVVLPWKTNFSCS